MLIISKFLNLFKNLKKYGFKGFFRKWRRGMEMIEPEDQIKTQIIGYIGSMLTMVLASIILIYKNFWYIALIFGFNIMIQWGQFTEKYQQYQTLKKLKTEEFNAEDMMEE